MPPTKKSKTTKDGNTDFQESTVNYYKVYPPGGGAVRLGMGIFSVLYLFNQQRGDDVQFWAEQKEDYLKENPSHTSFFSAEDEDKDDGDDSCDDDVVDATDKN
eukprot:scaffold31908_cov55-Cyclotella_meneghiniana.AAC.5